ncbi:MAG: recombination protein RecR [Clostridia bacterium]|nr:recombination protein RecR [Clostridia bacterium]
MASLAAPLAKLIEQLERLPGLGPKSAQRIAFHILSMPTEQVDDLADTITTARSRIHECRTCCNLTESEECPICGDPTRDRSTICVVGDPRDVLAIERTREYRGLYHVLHGNLSPMDGITPEKLRIKELLHRVTENEITEVIMANNSTVEGETTAMYLSKLLGPFGISVTRLAYGLPVGADLEYADEVTLRHSIEGRSRMGG